MDNLQIAGKYIEAYGKKADKKYAPLFHLCPPVGWMNDPNGLVCFKGEYHLFYQYNPYDSYIGAMYWGHAVSDDLYSFRHEKPALAPKRAGESIFSGGALEINEKLVIFYTLHVEKDGLKSEETYMAESLDGVNFSESKKVFDNSLLPGNLSRADFRDPCPALIDGKLYVFVGGKDTVKNEGVIVVLGGDKDKLTYKFYMSFPELGDMGECPSYCKVGGKDVIAVSGCNTPERGNSFKNLNSSVFIVGNIDFESGKMDVDFVKEIDKGDCFYAPQFVNGAPEPIIFGWQEMWGKKYPTREWGHGWAGAFSSPRVIEIRDGEILQLPADGYAKYFKDGEKSGCAEITVVFGGAGKVKFAAENGSFTVGLNGGVYLDTLDSNNMNGCIRRTDGNYESCEVKILLDKSGLEVFVCGGREAISTRIYLDGDYEIIKEGCVKEVTVKNMGV